MFYTAPVVILLVLTPSIQSKPVINGEDVGQITRGPGNKYKITGQEIFPFMVHLEITGELKEKADRNSTALCGGVIISRNAVLTAGHCLSGFMRKPQVLIQAGIVHLDREKTHGQKRYMKDYILHDGYLDEPVKTEQILIFSLSDIAIVFLDSPFKFGPRVRNAILSDLENGPPAGQEGLILGWGNRNNNMLQKLRMKILSRPGCQKYFKKLAVQDDTFCAIDDSKISGPCSGDSGGPFIMDDGKVYGIVSYLPCSTVNGVGIPDSSKPSVYTNIGDYYEWIKEELEKRDPSVSRSGSKRRNTENQKSSSSDKKAKKTENKKSLRNAL